MNVPTCYDGLKVFGKKLDLTHEICNYNQIKVLRSLSGNGLVLGLH